MAIDTTPSESTLLDGLLEPFSDCLTPEVAQKLVNLHANEAVVARVEELADKCNEGTLTPDERAEYESYVSALLVISILQAKARKLLGTAPAS